MSTQVHLIGIKTIEVGGEGFLRLEAEAVPTVVEMIEDLGFSGLRNSLEASATDVDYDVLHEIQTKEDGGYWQFLLKDPAGFLEDIADRPWFWDSQASGWEQAIEAIQKSIDENQAITWWFWIDY